ncbi:MAG: metallophosphoesterase, partial [Bacteroidota bacterium]
MIRYAIIIFSLLLLNSCANYHLNYTPDARNWARAMAPTAAPVYTVYLIGDAGAGNADWTPPALVALQKQLAYAGENSALVFLGDNIYPDGMAPKAEAEERSQDEAALDVQLGVFEDYAGRVFFVAGNHDWYEYGVAGLRREAKYLNKHSDDQAELLPRPGCGDPVEVELTDDITLLLLDSQWWLANWRGETAINDGCEAKSRADFAFLLQEAMKSNRRKELLVAMHHPIYSNGPHGGNFTAGQHLFPLRDVNENLYLPLPLVGSFFQLLRASIGARQDLANSTYKDLRNLLLTQANTMGDVIFAAGHEHSMQYWRRDGQHFIVSGSGSKESAVKVGSGAEFAYGHYGYSQLNYYEDGQVWVQFHAAEEDGSTELVYQRQVKLSYTERGTIDTTIHQDNFSLEQERTVPLSAVDFSRNG